MRRAISSGLTPFYQFIFPIVLIVVVCAIGLSGGSQVWFAAPVLMVGIALWFVFAGRLRSVQVDDRTLYVSNYLKEIRIPLSDVSMVTENPLIKFHPVTVHLRTRSVFGEWITFMPKARLLLSFRGHPVVEELNRLVAQAKANSRQPLQGD